MGGFNTILISNSLDNNHQIINFEGLEVGAVSVKWVRRTEDGKLIEP